MAFRDHEMEAPIPRMLGQTRPRPRRGARSLCAAFAIGLALCGRAAAQTGPLVTFYGPVNMLGMPLACSGSNGGPIPVCQLANGSGFRLVVEGRPGPAGNPVGSTTFNATGLPDLQIQVDQPLGNGSASVCDDQLPLRGGVAPLSPPDLSFSAPGPVNDFACRFTADPCIFDQFGEPRYLLPLSTTQFCATIDPVLVFPAGDTLLSVRLRDTGGLVGEVRQIVLRVGAGTPLATVTAGATASLPPSWTRTATATRTPTSVPSVPLTASASPTRTASPSAPPTNSRTPTATAAHSATPAVSTSPTPPAPPTATATATPSVVPTASEPISLDDLIHAIFDESRQAGADVSDDDRVSAADLPARIVLGP